MVTLDQIKNNLQDVLPEHTARCERIWDFQTGEDFYLVESESDPTVEYKVQYSTDHGFLCNCEAGKWGFARVTRHPSGVCKHVRWSVKSWLDEVALEQALQEAQEALADKVAAQATVILPIVKPLPVVDIEASMPEWLRRAVPAPHMKYAPKELN